MSNLALKGAVVELKQQRAELALIISSKIKAIKDLLATSAIDKIEDINLASVHILADDALTDQQEYFAVLSQLKKAEAEL